MGKRRQKLQAEYLFEQYRKEHDLSRDDAIEPHLVAAWAVRTGRYDRPPVSPEEVLRRSLSRFLRDEHVTDPQGRVVRKNHAVIRPEVTADGIRRRSTWHTIESAPPDHMQTSLQLRRRAAFNDVHQLSLDFESYNDNNVHGAILKPMDFDFNRDLEEVRHSTTYDEEREDDFTDDDGEPI